MENKIKSIHPTKKTQRPPHQRVNAFDVEQPLVPRPFIRTEETMPPIEVENKNPILDGLYDAKVIENLPPEEREKIESEGLQTRLSYMKENGDLLSSKLESVAKKFKYIEKINTKPSEQSNTESFAGSIKTDGYFSNMLNEEDGDSINYTSTRFRTTTINPNKKSPNNEASSFYSTLLTLIENIDGIKSLKIKNKKIKIKF